jgi:yeast amino acid transporter
MPEAGCILTNRGPFQVEFALGMIKILAVLGFIIFGIIVDCGGVKTDHRGYIGFRYWNDSKNGNVAFRNGECDAEAW